MNTLTAVKGFKFRSLNSSLSTKTSSVKATRNLGLVSALSTSTSSSHNSQWGCAKSAPVREQVPRFTRAAFRENYFRPFATTARWYTESSPPPRTQSFADPDRADLFYHLFHPPTELSSSVSVYALSFLPYPPASVMSRTVIGWLPAVAEGSEDIEGLEEEGAGLNDFQENIFFRELLHEALQSALRDDTDDIQRNGAIQLQQGWMHINDERNIPPLGRIADPDDILASVRVEDGKILAETYQAMPSYRACTSDGILKLTEGLANRLKERLELELEREKQVSP